MTLLVEALSQRTERAFQLFKYAIYGFLIINTLFFLWEDYRAAQFVFAGGVTPAQIIEAFPTFVDSFSWFVLIIVFELQTFVIPDEKLVGRLKWGLNGLAGLCYVFVFLANIGYYEKSLTMYGFEATEQTDPCQLVGSVDAYTIKFDEYELLSAETCINAPKGLQYINEHVSIAAENSILRDIQALAAADVINATTWIILLLLIWLDILLQLAGKLSDKLLRASAYMKGALYLILIAACAFWFWIGEWVDGWDALLWILAFFTIELNIFNWHNETDISEPDLAQDLKSS